MKSAIILFAIAITNYTHIIAQVNYYPSVQWQPAVPAKQNSNSTNTNQSNPNYQQVETPSYQQPTQPIALETRAIGFYEEGYGDNLAWKRMSLKIEVITNRFGQDEIKIVAFKDEAIAYWTTLNYSNVTKTYGEISKDFSYQVYVLGKTVYFNI